MQAKARARRGEVFAPGHPPSVIFLRRLASFLDTRGQEFHVRFPSKLSEDLSGLSEALSVPPPLLILFSLCNAQRDGNSVQRR